MKIHWTINFYIQFASFVISFRSVNIHLFQWSNNPFEYHVSCQKLQITIFVLLFCNIDQLNDQGKRLSRKRYDIRLVQVTTQSTNLHRYWDKSAKSFFKTNFYVEDVYLKYTFFKRRKPFENTSAFFNAKTLFTFKISLVNPLSERHCIV